MPDRTTPCRVPLHCLLRHPLPPLLLRNLLRLPGGVGMNGGFTLKLRGGVDDGRL